jgi:hypothetical protein
MNSTELHLRARHATLVGSITNLRDERRAIQDKIAQLEIELELNSTCSHDQYMKVHEVEDICSELGIVIPEKELAFNIETY